MANNCLVTKLKSSVNNESLLTLGKIIVDVLQVDNMPVSDRSLSLTGTGTITLKVISGSIYFTDSTGSQNQGTTKTGNNTIGCYVSNGNGKIEISSKYDVNVLGSSSSLYEYFSINCAQFDYLNANHDNENVSIKLPAKASGDIGLMYNINLKSLDVQYSKNVYGNIHCKSYGSGGMLFINNSAAGIDFSNEDVDFAEIQVQNNKNVTGTLADCVSLNLTRLSAYNSTLTGSVEDFFKRFWTLGKRSGDNVTLIAYLPQTFKGNNIIVNTTYVGEFTNAGIVLTVGGSQVASYNGTSWTYNS